ncbi:MAG: hypothetical protein R6W66_08820 [Pelovirga sp.]
MTDTYDTPLDPEQFSFWFAPAGMSLSIGEEQELPLPAIPLPLRSADLPADPAVVPAERLIGEGLYDYLCSFPECPHAAAYADILRQAYPFLIADLGAQLLVLDLRSSDVSALRHKMALLKILLYLEPDNFGLLHKLGVASLNLALHPTQLQQIRTQLLDARQWFEKARRAQADDVSNLDYLGQVCYLCGNYHQAQIYWQSALQQAGTEKVSGALAERIDNLTAGTVPLRPLQEALEQVGSARQHYDRGAFDQARTLLEEVLHQGDLPRAMPFAEFFYLLGLCREIAEDYPGAYEALMTATTLDDKHELAQQALARVMPEQREGC